MRKRKKRVEELKGMSDVEHLLSIFNHHSRVLDDCARVLLDYGYGKISRQKMEEEIAYIKVYNSILNKAIDLYLENIRNARS